MFLCKNLSRKCVRIAAFVFLVAVSALAAQAQVVFSPPKNISNTSGNTQAQQIALDKNGNVNVMWVDTSQGNAALFFNRSSDGGVTFSVPRNISNQTATFINSPELAVDSGGNIFVIWSSSSGSVFFVRSIDGGSTFTAPQLISHANSSGSGGRMAVDASGNLDIVWSDDSAGNSTVFFSRSTDGGASFSPAQSISSNPGGGPQIAVDPSGNINVIWLGGDSSHYDIWFSRSSDGGSTFSSAYLVQAIPISSSPFNPTPSPANLQIVTDESGIINLIWTDGFFNGDWFDYSVLSSHSTDGGTTFSTPQILANSAGGSRFPSIAAGPSSSVNVLFQTNVNYPSSFATGINDFLRRSVDGGATFTDVWHSNGCADAGGPAAVATEASGRISVAYGFDGGPNCPGGGLFFTQSAAGSNFSAPQNISGNSASVSPVIAADSGGSIYVAWEEILPSQTSFHQNVFFSRSVALATVAVSPSSMTGGSSSTGTVTMNGPAPTGGAVISLTSSDPSVSVPATVTIPEGTTSATFTVTTSAVSATTNVTISATFNGVTQDSSLTVRLAYNFSGFLMPLLNDGSALFHSGRTVPVKFQLTMPDGSMVTNAKANIQVFQIQNTPSGTLDQDMSVTASGSSTSGTAFRFDATSNQYIYNLDTTGYASGTYLLRTTVSDGSTHDVQFSIQ